MSNENPNLVECKIKSFESRAGESLWVTLDVPLTIAPFMTKTAADGLPLRILVEAVPAVPVQNASVTDGDGVPEQIAEQNTSVDKDGDLRLGAGQGMGWFCCESDFVEAHDGKHGASKAIREWLAGLIREGFAAGVASVAQTKADGAAALVETYGPDALAKAREEGRADAFRKVAEWCQTSVPDTIDFDASIVEEVANDAIGRLQNDAYNGDSRARKEGRQQGQAEIIAYFDSTAEQHVNARDRGQREAHSLRAQAARLDEEARVHQATADMARGVAAELRSITSKEPA